jgi:hypothetical protein
VIMHNDSVECAVRNRMGQDNEGRSESLCVLRDSVIDYGMLQLFDRDDANKLTNYTTRSFPHPKRSVLCRFQTGRKCYNR